MKRSAKSKDSSWRMTGIVSPSRAFGYKYPTANPASALISGIALPNGALITNTYDALARLTGTALANQFGHVLDGYVYGLDLFGLRTNITRNLGLTTNTVAIGDDGINQLISWSVKETNGSLRHNEQLTYAYDAAGNLNIRTKDALVQIFNVDALNQISNVTRTGTLTVTGATPVPATTVTNNGVSETIAYDLNGNETSVVTTNSTTTYQSDAANRLVSITSGTNTGLTNQSLFTYDGLGRRVQIIGQSRMALS